MPLRGVRYRVKTTKSGKRVRLAFKEDSGKVIEAKNLKTGAVHTPAEFKTDKKRAKKAKKERIIAVAKKAKDPEMAMDMKEMKKKKKKRPMKAKKKSM